MDSYKHTRALTNERTHARTHVRTHVLTDARTHARTYPQELAEMNIVNVRGLFADRKFPWELETQLELEPETQVKQKQTMSRWADRGEG